MTFGNGVEMEPVNEGGGREILLFNRLVLQFPVANGLVVVFGSLSIWFNDERFFKMKPTIIYLLFAGILAGLRRAAELPDSELPVIPRTPRPVVSSAQMLRDARLKEWRTRRAAGGTPRRTRRRRPPGPRTPPR